MDVATVDNIVRCDGSKAISLPGAVCGLVRDLLGEFLPSLLRVFTILDCLVERREVMHSPATAHAIGQLLSSQTNVNCVQTCVPANNKL